MRPWEMNIRHVVPYISGDQPAGGKLIELNTDESPRPPVPGVERALGGMDMGRLRKYPDPSPAELVTTLAEYYGVGEDQVFVGVGSDDVMAISFLAFFNSQKPMLLPGITYSFYKVWADLYRTPYKTLVLDRNMAIRSLDYKRENRGIIFPNPNAPTSLYMSLDRVEEIVKANQDVIIVVNKAYIDFAGLSARELLPGYDDLLMVQTFSEFRSMAGIRIGFALESPTLIKALNDVEYSYNSYTMNLPSQIAGTQVVKDGAHSEGTRAKIITTRKRSKERSTELGFTFPDPMTDFILVTHEHVLARAIFDTLKREQIYVRYFNAPRLNNNLRVGIGAGEEMDILSRFLEEYLKEWKPAGGSE